MVKTRVTVRAFRAPVLHQIDKVFHVEHFVIIVVYVQVKYVVRATSIGFKKMTAPNCRLSEDGI